MRPAGSIKRWLSIEKMFEWLQSAPDEGSYKRRMAVWLTHTGKLNAPKVAEILGVSTQAVWLWIKQYNQDGPVGLERRGRGGRRWGYMTREQERMVLKDFLSKARSGRKIDVKEVKQAIEGAVGRKVSLPYVYRLLGRHGWSEIVAQSHAGKVEEADEFSRLSRPWLRNEGGAF